MKKLIALVIASSVVASCDDKAKTDPAGASASASVATTAAAASSSPPPSSSTTPTAITSTPAPSVPDAIAAQHVLIAYKGADKAPKNVTRSKADAKKRAEEVAAKAKAGTDFSSLVAEYSDDPA